MNNKELKNTFDKHIAKNTVLLMLRMAVAMIISLIIVRLLRQALGTEDYGIFNAITGVVQLMICLNTVLATSSQRYISVAMGEGDRQKLNDSFYASVRISFILCAVTFLVMETIGLWFVVTQMNYPAERLVAVMVIFQIAIATFLMTLIQVPYIACVMAHEKMDLYAWVTILENIGRLMAAGLLLYLPGDKMVLYEIGLLLTTSISTLIYIHHCRKHYEETQSQGVSDRSIYRQLTGFTGWMLYGTVANALMLQGSMLVLNTKIGPLANAAFAVAIQMYNALTTLGNTVVLSTKPQITMNCSSGNKALVNRLFWLTNGALVLLFVVVVMPLLIWMPTILRLWLTEVDTMTIDLCRWMLVAGSVLLVGAPITMIIQAIGKVREYHFTVESIMILSLPLSIALLHYSGEALSVCISIFVCAVVAHIVRIQKIWKYYYSK